MNSLRIILPFVLLFLIGCGVDEPDQINNLTQSDNARPQGPGPRGQGGNQGGNQGGDNDTGQDTNNDTGNQGDTGSQGDIVTTDAIFRVFGTSIDLGNLPNYANQPIPNYINRDNSRGAIITNEEALLGRVLFYDRNLSVDNTISCASCHQQQNGFSDRAQASTGVAGVTGRHSMRLINARFATETRFFWDERANSLEAQTIMPIQDHVEMGFSGTSGDPDLGDLISKLEGLDYYQELFTFVYDTPDISADKMQDALSQFIRSIQSFDSSYDTGRSQVNNDNNAFANFSAQENRGKNLFMRNPQNGQNGRTGGGLGCDRCHRAPEFDIVPNSDNNGVIGVIGDPNAVDLDVTRSPSLRDLFNPSGALNSPLMHTGDFDVERMINHYNNIPNNNRNNNLDNRLRGAAGGRGQRLNITPQERADLISFLRTLSGANVYVDEKWSDPFR